MTGSKRRHQDMMKLMMSDFDVHIPDDSLEQGFYVKFEGPTETPYEGGVWKVHVTLPKEYPFKSPSIGFKNRIFHPNVDDMSGSVCLDVINQTWSPMFNLVNIFEMFLPQLLRYPNPSDPLNGEAAALMMRDSKAYDARIRDYVRRHASAAFNLDDEKVQNTPQKKEVRAADVSGTSPAGVEQLRSMSTTSTNSTSHLDDLECDSDVSEMSDCDL